MAKKLIKKWFPNQDRIRHHQHLQFLGGRLHDPNLWHLNRRSVAGAFAVGLFCAMLPIPFQMVVAAVLAVLLRVNLPISVMLVWITNPLTMGPIFYFAYRLGLLLMGLPAMSVEDATSFDWLAEHWDEIWEPLLLGSLLIGLVLALLGYVGMRLFWRWHVLQRWQERRRRRRARKAQRQQRQE